MNACFSRFQKRHNVKPTPSHGKSGDADESALLVALPSIRRELAKFSREDVYNADEFGSCFRMAPDRRVADHMLPDRKKDKTRLTVLACANYTSTDRFRIRIIGNAQCPCYFKNKTGEDSGFNDRHNTREWVTMTLFSNGYYCSMCTYP